MVLLASERILGHIRKFGDVDSIEMFPGGNAINIYIKPLPGMDAQRVMETLRDHVQASLKGVEDKAFYMSAARGRATYVNKPLPRELPRPLSNASVTVINIPREECLRLTIDFQRIRPNEDSNEIIRLGLSLHAKQLEQALKAGLAAKGWTKPRS